MINELNLRAFFEKNRAKYLEYRNSGDLKKWDEQYKWDVLPKLNETLSKIEISSENSTKIAKILQDNINNFAHWMDLDDLQEFANHNNAYQIFEQIRSASPSLIDSIINSFDQQTPLLMSGKKFAPSTLAYILTAYDCRKFCLYRENIMKEIAKICAIHPPKNKGEKYKLLNDAAHFIGNLMAEEGISKDDFLALNGQDFIWTVLSY